MSETNDTGDWRSKYNVTQRWSEARKKKLFTDVNFTVGSGETAKTYSAHKNVLAFSSPVFEAMFFGALAEKKNNITISDIDPEAFDFLLRFVYGEQITFPRISIAAKTHVIADKYLVTDLQTMADDHISKATLDDPQFWELIHQDRFFIIETVRKKCLDYIKQKAATLFKSYFFANVSCEVVVAILQMDKISISEYELLSAVVRWGIGNVQSEKNLRTTLEVLLRYIRFSNFTVEEFCNFLDFHPGLLNSEDSLAIMKHLHKPTVYKLPVWCSTSSSKRNA